MEESLKKSSPLLEAELTSELGWVAESFIHLSFEDIWKHSRAFLGDPFWDLFILTNYCHISGENCEHYPLAFPSIPHLLLIHLYLYICIKFVYIFIYQYLYTAGIFCFKYFPFTSTFNFLHFFATYTSYRENTEVFLTSSRLANVTSTSCFLFFLITEGKRSKDDWIPIKEELLQE